VVDEVSFEIRRGEIFGVIGANGSGKSTLIRMISTLLLPDGGDVRIFGHDVVKEPMRVRPLINRVSADPSFFRNMTAMENLLFFGRVYGLSPRDVKVKTPEILRRLGFEWQKALEPMSHLSRGQQQKVAVARSFLTSPVLMLLDEPTTGLDPRSRRVMWDIVRGLVTDGVTILLTTQYLEEADRLASRIALLDHGRVVATGTPAELKRLVPGGSVRLEFGDAVQLDRAASAIGDGAVRDDDALSLQVPSDGSVHGLRRLIERLDSNAIEVEGLSVQSADLDDVFLSLTGSTDPQRADLEVPAP